MRDLIPLLVSLLMPPLVSWLKDASWPDWAKVCLSVATSGVAAAIVSAIEGFINVHTIGTSTAMIFSGATIFYKTWFQSSQLNERLERGSNQCLE